MTKRILKIGITVTVSAIVLTVGFFLFSEYADDVSSAFVGFINDNLFGLTDKNESATLENDVNVNVRPTNSCAEFSLSQEQENTLNDYFRLYYSSLGALKCENITKIFTYESNDQCFAQMELNYLTDKRSAAGYDLTFSQCDVSYTYRKSAKIDAKSVEITLVQSAVYDFGCTALSASEAATEHIFVLEKTADGWLVDAHTADNKALQTVMNVFEALIAESGYTLSDLTYSYVVPFTEEAQRRLKTLCDDGYKALALKKTESGENAEISAEYEYEREKAVEYALLWTADGRKIRNSEVFKAYEPNDMCFVSQCILAGEIPMDAQGNSEKQWKWFSDGLNLRIEKAGMSRSWTSVPDFAEYCRKNEGFGMKCVFDADFYSLAAGDVILFKENGEYVSAAIIAGVIVGNDNRTVDFLLCANDGDMRCFPMSATAFTDFSAVHIVGYDSAII